MLCQRALSALKKRRYWRQIIDGNFHNHLVTVFLLFILAHKTTSASGLINCSGAWGQWLGAPSIPCDQANLTRFRPKEGNEPCKSESDKCCKEVKVHKYPDKCTDFAYNTNINLKKEKCKNNGKLFVGSRGHLECKCSDKYKGIRCEIGVCFLKCENGGTCGFQNGELICLCPDEFTGKRCELHQLDCTHPETCQNNGVCVVSTEKQGNRCVCKVGYTGRQCEFGYTDSGMKKMIRDPQMHKFLSIFGVLLFFLIFALLLKKWKLKKIRKEPAVVKNSPAEVEPPGANDTFRQALIQLNRPRKTA